MVYHMVMARRQVLVQLEDELVNRLDALAERLDVSRSELLRKAARALLDADRIAEQDRQLIAAYRAQPQDPEFTETLGRLAARTFPE